MYDQVTGSLGRQIMQKYEQFFTDSVSWKPPQLNKAGFPEPEISEYIWIMRLVWENRRTGSPK